MSNPAEREGHAEELRAILYKLARGEHHDPSYMRPARLTPEDRRSLYLSAIPLVDTLAAPAPREGLWASIRQAYIHGFCRGHAVADRREPRFQPELAADRYMDELPVATARLLTAAPREQEPYAEDCPYCGSEYCPGDEACPNHPSREQEPPAPGEVANSPTPAEQVGKSGSEAARLAERERIADLASILERSYCQCRQPDDECHACAAAHLLRGERGTTGTP